MTPEQRNKLMQIDASVSRGLMTIAVSTILLVFVALTIAGFKGCLKPKHETKLGAWNDTTNIYRIQSTNLAGGIVITTNRSVYIGGGWFTNVVISNDFDGIIWIGDTFYKMWTKTNSP